MKLTDYCIHNPIVAWVGNLLIMLVGWLCLDHMVVREYPAVSFNKFMIHVTYPNASADLVETSVASVLEEYLAGLDGLDNITSTSKEGGCMIHLGFQPNTDLNRSWMNIREAIGLARDHLPQDIHEPLVERETASQGRSFIFISVASSGMTQEELTHFTNVQVKNVFKNVPGVVRVEVWGKPYNIQVSLRPHDMYAFGINADAVSNVLKKSQASLPVGKFQGKVPATLEMAMPTMADYENLVVKVNTEPTSGQSSPVLLKHIADVKLVCEEESIMRVNGRDSIGIGIYKADDANPLEVSDAARQAFQMLQPQLPHHIQMNLVMDQADFVRHAVGQMKSALLEALICVGLVIWLFLRRLKMALIPLMAIPMSLFGGVIFLSLLGMSINLMTLMAMVLAVGLVVDDSIVVMENIQQNRARGLSPLEAAIQGSREIGFAIVAMTGTLMSVYIPLAFIHGTIGQLFGEFAVALAGSVIVSGVVALTLSPYMCSRLTNVQHATTEAWFIKCQHVYQKGLAYMLERPWLALGIWGTSVVLVMLCLRSLPHEVAPAEDRNTVGVFIDPLPGYTLNDMNAALYHLEERLHLPIQAARFAVVSPKWGGNMMYCLPPSHQRSLSAGAYVEHLRQQTRDLVSVDAYPWSWSTALPGVDDGTRAQHIEIVLSTTGSHRDMFRDVKKAVHALQDEEQGPLFQDLSCNVETDTMAYKIDIDRHAMGIAGIQAASLAKTMEVFFDKDSSLTFSKDGMLYHITLQGASTPTSLSSLYITNDRDERISLNALADMRLTVASANLYHHGCMRSMKLITQLPKGMTMQQAMAELSVKLDQHLQGTYTRQWDGAAKMNVKAHATLIGLLGLSLLFVLSLLVLQFHNVVDPLISLLTVPLAACGALCVLWGSGGTLNIYTQIGLITLMGLITKHGILIVEFVNQHLAEGGSLQHAIVQAATQRLRPILMTTLAMVLGALPLIWSHHPGYEARHAMGLTLLSGLIVGTLLTIFVLPVLCKLVKGRMTPDELTPIEVECD